MNLEYDYLFKLILIGDSGIGKSCLLRRYTDNNYEENYVSTIGVDFKIKTEEIDGKTVKLQIWDTAGQERFSAITKSYYRGAHAIIMAFDLTSLDSFKRARHWLKESEQNENATKFLVGTKCDGKVVVDQNDIMLFANENGLTYFRTSSKTGDGIDNMFNQICYQLKEKIVATKKDDRATVQLSSRPFHAMTSPRCC